MFSFVVLDTDWANVTFGAIGALFLPAGACLVARDTRVWMTWRIYTLAIVTHQDSMLDSLSERLYPLWLHPENRSVLDGTAFEYGLLVITGIFIAILCWQRVSCTQGRSTLGLEFGPFGRFDRRPGSSTPKGSRSVSPGSNDPG